MGISRRDFIHALGAGGIGLSFSGLVNLTGRMEQEYSGPLYIMIHCGGGWDVTSICDPKGARNNSDPDPMNHYLGDLAGGNSQVIHVGNHSFAPNYIGGVNSSLDDTLWDTNGFNRTFLERYQNRLLVLNGVDTGTNSHDTGVRYSWSGSIIDGFPGFGAVVAKAHAPGSPMSFVLTGGYEGTDGIVAASRIGGANILRAISYPNSRWTGDPDTIEDEDNLFFPSEVNERMSQARAERHTAAMRSQGLKDIREARSQLFIARSGSSELEKLNAELDTAQTIDLTGSTGHWDTSIAAEFAANTGNVYGMLDDARTAMASYKAGLTVSVSLSSRGGWDTHGNNDFNNTGNILTLLHGMDAIQMLADQMGIGNKITFIVTGDFGRTPGYNPGNGKDHWSITSAMFMGARIQGGRVIGTTTHDHVPIPVNRNTLEPDNQGIRITPAIIHRALRRMAKVSDLEIERNYPIPSDDDLDLFGADS